MDELSLLLLHMWQCRIKGSITGRLRYKGGCDTSAMSHKILVEYHVSKCDRFVNVLPSLLSGIVLESS